MAAALRTKVDELSGHEFGLTVSGVVIGSILHMVSESMFDKFLEAKYPEKYTLYSTGITSGIFTTIGVALILWSRRAKMNVLGYFGAGMVFVELQSWLDMVRISFELAR